MTNKEVKLSHPKYRPDLDGLRAIAVLAILVFHVFPGRLRGGFIGVDVFFVISGYLISTIIFENLERGTFSFAEFYSRRIKRIFPALILVLLACYTFSWFTLLTGDFKHLGKHIAASAVFIINLVLWSEAGYFDKIVETKPLLHLWSLGIEEQFYIVWPLLVWISWKCKFNILLITLVVILISFLFNLSGIQHDTIATFYAPQTRFWELLAGSVIAWYHIHKKSSCRKVKKSLFWEGKIGTIISDKNITANIISFLGVFFLLYGFFRINRKLDFPGNWALLPVAGSALLILASPKAWFNRVFLSNKILVWFGLISFPLYLWHWPLLSFFRIFSEEPNDIV